MKILLIGPTYPFRGGIAHYTTLLCRALREDHEVKFISFKRQYPRLFFPGKTDQDISKHPLRVDNVNYMIDPLNPLSWLATVRLITEFQPEKLVLPWWASYWALPFWTILTHIKRSLDCEIVFICHNVVDHESQFFSKYAARAVLSKADRLLTHSHDETRKLHDLFGPHVNGVTAFLPTYAELKVKEYTPEEAKTELGLTGDVLLFFGFVRPYKGLGILLEAMPAVLKEKQVTLLIVGEFWWDKKKYLDQIRNSGLSDHVKIVDRYVPNEEMGQYFAAADLVVQPYISASGSAISQLAYGFDRPVIATRVGSLPEVIEDGQNGRIVEPGDAQGLAEAIVTSLEPATKNRFLENAIRTKERFSWKRMADIVTGVVQL